MARPISVDNDPETALWQAFARSVRSNVLAEAGSQAMRIGGFVVLARALAPSDFGLMRVLIAVTTLAGLVNAAGMADALIQRRDLTPSHESTAWWINLALAIGAGSLLYVGAPLISAWLRIPEAAPGIRLLCVPMLLDGTSSIGNARLRRRMEFGALARADVIAEAAFLLTALSLVAAGLPRWSLIVALGARLLCHAIAVWSADPYLPSMRPRLAPARDLTRFAASVLGGRFLCVLSNNADYLVIGRMLGSSVLGYYVMAWDLLRFVPDRLYNVAGRVTFPAFCRLQDDAAGFRRAYLDFAAYIARIVLPIAFCAAAAAPQLLGGIFGARWIGSATALRLLSVGLALSGLRIAIGSVFYTRDHPSFDILLHGVRVVLIVAVVASTARAGLFGVSAGMSAVEAVVSILGQRLACLLIGLNAASLLAAWWPGMRLAIACGAGALAGGVLADRLNLGGFWALSLCALPPASVFCIFELAMVRELLSKLLSPRLAPPPQPEPMGQ